MGEAWAINMSMLKEHGIAVGLVLIVTYALVGALFFLLFADVPDMMFNPAQADPEAMATMVAGRAGLLILVGLITTLISIAGYFISWRIALAGGQDTIGGAIGYGLLAAFPALFAFIVLYIAFIILFFIVSLVAMGIFGVTVMGADSAGEGAGVLVGIILFYVGLLGLIAFLFARLGTTGVIMTVERSYNPFRALVDSWRLTRHNSLKLMVYLFLISIAFLVIYFIMVLVAGLFSSLSIALGIIIAVSIMLPLTVFYVLVPAGIYGALVETDPGVSDIFS
jgi:hypothetical protein